jgi:hypothetical protein
LTQLEFGPGAHSSNTWSLVVSWYRESAGWVLPLTPLVVRKPVMRTITVPAGASNRQLAPDVAGGLESSAAVSAPFAVPQLLVVNPPEADVGFHPTAAFGWPSGSVHDVTT